MKKTILTGASILALTIAAPAFAQDNQSTINQNGSSAVATVTQKGEDDISTITQNSGGTVTVDQDGVTGSTSTVTTNADDRAPESRVDIIQSDDGTSSAATGLANVSTVTQANVNGFGTSGTGSTVSVTQTHNAAGAGQNFSNVDQGPNAVSGQVIVSQMGGDNTSRYSSTTSTDNDANIMQTGENNTSDVVQNFQNGSAVASVTQSNVAGGDLNTAVINQISLGFGASPEQFAQGASAAITQDGAGNDATIDQTGFDVATPFNVASSTQLGDDNASSITQSSTTGFAMVTQTGDENDSTIRQSAEGTSATVMQTEVGGGANPPRNRGTDGNENVLGDLVRSNFSNIEQTASSSAGVTQSGELNRSEILQSGVGAGATVSQTATYNNSQIEQSAAATANVTQGGLYGDNNSRIIQSATATGASATVTQMSDETLDTFFPTNDSVINQFADADATVTQTGQQNESFIDQNAGAVNAVAVVEQTNALVQAFDEDINTSTITQNADTSAFVQQIGEGNSSTISQLAASNPLQNNLVYAVEVQQLGTDGISTVLQNVGTGNEATVEQELGSEDADSFIDQSGSDNFADVTQGGIGNESVILQSGNGNTATVTQMSDNNVSMVTQSGNNNTATVTQGNTAL